MPRVAEIIGRSNARRVSDSVASVRVERGGFYVPLEFKAPENDGRIRFRGYANVATIDRVGDVVDPAAFKKSLRSFLKNNPQLFYMHDWYVSVGGITDGEVRENGLYVEGYLAPPTDENGDQINGGYGDFLRMIRGQVKRGQLRTLSIGFRLLDSRREKRRDPLSGKEVDVRVITNLELLEISLVTLPASRESVIQARSYVEEVYGSDVAQSLVSDALADHDGGDGDRCGWCGSHQAVDQGQSELRRIAEEAARKAIEVRLNEGDDDEDDDASHDDADQARPQLVSLADREQVRQMALVSSPHARGSNR